VFNKADIKTAQMLQDELDAQAIDSQVSVYKTYLDNTDHKTYSDYEILPNEVISDVIAERKVARDYIRANKGVTV
jgi:hypothetical protein